MADDFVIDYNKIPFKEKRSTGEHIKKNAFYIPEYEEDPNWHDGYDATDFFGLTFIHSRYEEEGDNV